MITHSDLQEAENRVAFDMEMLISHEAIYRYLYVLPRGELKRTLVHALRKGLF
jgi:hypothetical protein